MTPLKQSVCYMYVCYTFTAQQAIQAATGLVPSQPQTRSETKERKSAADNDMQNDILQAVAQILTQSQQVDLPTFNPVHL